MDFEDFEEKIVENKVKIFILCSPHNPVGRVWKEWVKELNSYLEENLKFVRIFLKKNLPEIKLIEPEGTYLLWLDFRALNLSNKQRDDLIINKAKLWLSKGETFGMGGEGFERINIACPRSVLKEALESLQIAFSTLNNTDFVV